MIVIYSLQAGFVKLIDSLGNTVASLPSHRKGFYCMGMGNMCHTVTHTPSHTTCNIAHTHGPAQGPKVLVDRASLTT